MKRLLKRFLIFSNSKSNMKKNNGIKEDFNTFIVLYEILNKEKERLEGKNGYLVTVFKSWYDDTIEKTFRDQEDYNVVINQEKVENDKIENNDQNALRFFKPYYDNYVEKIASGNIPYFLKSKNLELDIDLSEKNISIEDAQEEYINMPEEKRKKEKIKILKELAIIYARKANALNRYKNNVNIDFKTVMNHKESAIANFLKYVVMYNSKVKGEEQIAFGISKSNAGPVLDISVPGYTRVSVHFGTYGKCKNVLSLVNKQVEDITKEPYFPEFSNGKIDMDSVFKERGYDLPTFGIINTGITNCMDYENSEVYETQIKGKNKKDKINDNRLEIFANLMYSDLNDREIFFIAERAGFGKKNLKLLKRVLNKREKRKIIAKNEKKDVKEIYIEEKINNCKNNPELIMKTINELYDGYMETSIIKEKNSIEDFVSMLKNSNVDINIIEQFTKQNENINEKESQDMEFEEMVKYVSDGEKISPDIFAKNFYENDALGFLFEKSENNDVPRLNEKYFSTIWENINTKDKMILILKLVEEKELEEISEEESSLEYKEECDKESERIQEIVLEKVIDDPKLEDYGDRFVEIIIDSLELLKNIKHYNKEEQIRLAKNLWDNYESILTAEEDKKEEILDEKEEFKNILDFFGVDTNIIENIENIKTLTYEQLMEIAKNSNVKDRRIIDNKEKVMSENEKDDKTH